MVRRSSLWLSPAGILIGYLLALFTATAGVVNFPFSIVALGLLFVVVGAFAVGAIPVIVITYVLMAITFARAIMGLGRRLLFGRVQNSGSQRLSKLRPLQKTVEPERADTRVWDRWIDGVR
jgi:hypothetical protein